MSSTHPNDHARQVGPAPPLMLGALLRIPFEQINLHINQALHAAGFGEIRPAHQSVFQHLPREGARVTTLADRAQITKQSMGALVADLVAWGYLERAPDAHDRRAHVVRRSARGWEVERVARTSLAQLEADWAQALGEGAFTQLYRTLQHLVRFIREDTLP